MALGQVEGGGATGGGIWTAPRLTLGTPACLHALAPSAPRRSVPLCGMREARNVCLRALAQQSVARHLTVSPAAGNVKLIECVCA